MRLLKQKESIDQNLYIKRKKGILKKITSGVNFALGLSRYLLFWIISHKRKIIPISIMSDKDPDAFKSQLYPNIISG